MEKTPKSFDVVIIGTGSAASTIAYKCRSAGWSVAVVDSRPFGGTCALRGCDPKKVLVGIEEVIDQNQRMKGKGITYSNENTISTNWHDLMRFKRSFTEPIPKNREEHFSKAGITAFHGRAHFVGPTSIEVKTLDNNNQHNNDNDNDSDIQGHILNGKYVVIASGAVPANLNIPGMEYITTSDQFLELDNLPENIVFVGGGYISFEFANIAAHAGAKATILNRSNRPLGHFDSDLVNKLIKKGQEMGIDIKLQAEVKRIEKSGGKFTVYASSTIDAGKGNEAQTTKDSEKKEYSIEADMVVHGAGRMAEIEDLNLQAAGIERDKKGIKVNEYLQSVSNPAVYAAGDAASTEGPQLTPVSAYEGRIVASNLLEGNHINPDYKGIPSVVFTIPPLASVGLLEEDAQKQGFRFKTNHMDTSGWYSSKRIGEKYSAFKVLIEENTERIIGAHILGQHADEVINIFALAIRIGIPANQLKEMMFAYPTKSSDISYML